MRIRKLPCVLEASSSLHFTSAFCQVTNFTEVVVLRVLGFGFLSSGFRDSGAGLVTKEP